MDRGDERLDSRADIDSNIARKNFDFFFSLKLNLFFLKKNLFPISATLLSLDYFPVLLLFFFVEITRNVYTFIVIIIRNTRGAQRGSYMLIFLGCTQLLYTQRCVCFRLLSVGVSELLL